MKTARLSNSSNVYSLLTKEFWPHAYEIFLIWNCATCNLLVQICYDRYTLYVCIFLHEQIFRRIIENKFIVRNASWDICYFCSDDGKSKELVDQFYPSPSYSVKCLCIKLKVQSLIHFILRINFYRKDNKYELRN